MKSIRLYLRTIKCYLQQFYYGLHAVSKSAYISFGSDISKDLQADDYCYIGYGATIGPKVKIGAYSMLGPKVMCLGDDHRYDIAGVPIIFSGRPQLRSTVIGRDVWIGAGAIILAGVEIGDGAIVAAGTVVTKNILPLEIHAGVPNRKIKNRFEDVDDRTKHLKMLLNPPAEGEFATHNR
jgi:acetyltransferase-like isoleucine patch superfamily enzyme